MATFDLKQKIVKLEELGAICDKLREAGRTLVHCHGVFDLVHLGHIRHLNSAKQHGDTLIVTLTADKHVKRGPGRPVFNHNLRAESLANLECVDYVAVVETSSTALEAITTIRPHFYVKGSDYREREKDITAKIYDEQDAVEQGGGQLVFTDDITFSSSQLLNSHLDAFDETTRAYLKTFTQRYNTDVIASFLQGISPLKILVIGDTIIDQYCYTTALGKSAKETIVSHRFEASEDFAGGGLATANHVAQLCSNVTLVTVLGEKESHEKFIRDHLNSRIDARFFFRPECVTTVKRRYVNQGDRQKLFQVCSMDDTPLAGEVEQEILAYLEENLPSFDLVIVSDFGHGLMTDSIMRHVTDNARCLALNVQTNSANLGFNFVNRYERADFVCIDERELRLATHDRYSDVKELLQRIHTELNCKQVIATRGALGSLSYNSETGFHEAPAFANQSVDKVGAGDAFFAYTSPCFQQGAPQDLMSFIGNATGSLAIQIVGNREPVQYVDLMKYATRLLKV